MPEEAGEQQSLHRTLSWSFSLRSPRHDLRRRRNISWHGQRDDDGEGDGDGAVSDMQLSDGVYDDATDDNTLLMEDEEMRPFRPRSGVWHHDEYSDGYGDYGDGDGDGDGVGDGDGADSRRYRWIDDVLERLEVILFHHLLTITCLWQVILVMMITWLQPDAFAVHRSIDFDVIIVCWLGQVCDVYGDEMV